MHHLILRKLLIVSIGLVGFLTACTRITSTELGGDLIPAVDGVTTLDTIMDVVTENFALTDTIRANKTDLQMLGAISTDPIFGKTRASLYFELKPDAFPFSIPGTKDSVVVDSAVLILSYKGAYGDSMQPLRLNVSEISQATPIYDTIVYPINYPNAYPISVSQQLAPTTTIDIRRLGDSVNNRFENTKNQIRIKLNQSVAKRFIKDYDSTNAYASDSAFSSYFAGFAVTADPGVPANALLKVSLSDTNTKFALYYSSNSTGATQRDTSVSYFRFNTLYGGSGDANYIVRDRTGSEAGRHINAALKSDSLVYVQTSPGTRVKIKVPGLANLSNRIIHRAELIAEQVPDDGNPNIETQMIPPRYLLLSVWDSAQGGGKRNVPNDYVMSSDGPNISNFGGFLASKAVTGYDKIAAYTFNLSRYVQGVVTRKDTVFNLLLSAPSNDSMKYIAPYPANVASLPTTIFLTPSVGNDVGDGRVRLGGGTHTRFRMRLRLVYSRI
jgi:hypothetical protein